MKEIYQTTAPSTIVQQSIVIRDTEKVRFSKNNNQKCYCLDFMNFFHLHIFLLSQAGYTRMLTIVKMKQTCKNFSSCLGYSFCIQICIVEFRRMFIFRSQERYPSLVSLRYDICMNVSRVDQGPHKLPACSMQKEQESEIKSPDNLIQVIRYISVLMRFSFWRKNFR